MRNLFLTLAMIIVTVGSAAASDKEDAISVMQRWIDGFNKADVKSAIAMCADQTSMIDDFPPHEWHGAGACAKWFSDFASMAKTAGISQSVIVVGSPSHVEMSPHLAYVVAPATLSFERNGKSTKDKGLLTVTLRKGASDWRITGWVWSDE